VGAALRLLGLTTLVALAGCFPYHYTLRPAISGHVSNAANGQPIANARVADPRFSNDDTSTAADGSFTLPARKQWSIWFILPQEPMRPGPLHVSADGFRDADWAWGGLHSSIVTADPIRLEPVTK
jgi:hypothetical protein